jgi:hypothetical protein
VFTKTTLAPYISREQVLALLHDSDRMLDLNPIIKSHTLLDAPHSIAFFSQVAAENKPPATGPAGVVPVYQIVEATSGGAEDAGSWRGGWGKRFVPETINYQTSMQNTCDGMITITHAPMGVHSVTRWVLKIRSRGRRD